MRKLSEYLSHFFLYHYLKLAVRAVLFVSALVLYIINKVNGSELPFGEIGAHPIFWGFWWIFLVAGMVLRLFPSKFETIGCQKQLKRNYVPTGEEKAEYTVKFFGKSTNISLKGSIDYNLYGKIIIDKQTSQ